MKEQTLFAQSEKGQTLSAKFKSDKFAKYNKPGSECCVF